MKFENRPIFQSPTVTMGVFRCHPSHPSFWNSGPVDGHLLVFPRTGVKILQFGRRPVIADPNVVVFYNREQEYRREPISEVGDRCEWFSFPSEVVVSAVSRFDPDAVNRPDEPFSITFGLTDDETYLTQRRVYRHAQTHGDNANALWIEETMIAVPQPLRGIGISSAGRIAGPRLGANRSGASQHRPAHAATDCRRISFSPDVESPGGACFLLAVSFEPHLSSHHGRKHSSLFDQGPSPHGTRRTRCQ